MTDKKNIFSKSKKQLLSEKIHDEILEMIIKNATDEDMVLNEGRLMEVFQVSKAPVREALIKLCGRCVAECASIWLFGDPTAGKGQARSKQNARSSGTGSTQRRV